MQLPHYLSITDAMGINKLSMYSTFGNKEELFVQATDYYINKHLSCISRI